MAIFIQSGQKVYSALSRTNALRGAGPSVRHIHTGFTAFAELLSK